MNISSKSTKRKLSSIERIKANSNFLREPLATELLQDTTHFASQTLMAAGVTFAAVQERIVQLLGKRTLGEIPLPENLTLLTLKYFV